VIWGEAGTNAQHSFYQLIHQGTDIIPLELIGFRECQYDRDFLYQGTSSQEKLLSNLLAQMIALALGQRSDNPNKEFKGNRPSHLLIGKKATPFAVGALLAYFEHKIAYEGFIWNINSFDQEGVQLGKVLATKIAGQFAAAREGNESESQPLTDTLLNQLASL
jgi:glucose-6-phosphate isomerase